MNKLYHSGSTLVLFFSGVSGSAFISNEKDNIHIPVQFKDDKGYIHLDIPITKNELIDKYKFLRTDGLNVTKYKMFC